MAYVNCAVMSNWFLHHIGVATYSIEKELPSFLQLGYSLGSEFFVEPSQAVRGIFIEAPNQPRLEILESITSNGEGVLEPYLSRGVKMYHSAYVVSSIEQKLVELKATGYYKVITPPTQGIFFKRFCFIMLANMSLVELIEVR